MVNIVSIFYEFSSFESNEHINEVRGRNLLLGYHSRTLDPKVKSALWEKNSIEPAMLRLVILVSSLTFFFDYFSGIMR
jgi:hypothetical protein